MSHTKLDRLERRLIAAANAARTNPYFGLPSWVDGNCISKGKTLPVICCGTGHWAQDFLRPSKGMDILAIVDDFHAGKQVLGLPCLDTSSMLELAAKYPDAICVNTGATDAGYSHWERLGAQHGLRMLNYLQALRLFHLEPDVRVADWRAPIVQRFDEYLSVAGRLVDELSVETLYSTLLYHLETEREHLLSVNRPGDATYFRSGIFEVGPDETYVDCGAFDGDSVLHFIRVVKGSFKSIHAFEPDPQNFAKLQSWHASESRFSYANRINLHQKAVGSTAGYLQLSPTGDAGACIAAAGSGRNQTEQLTTVEAVSLDGAINEPISLLKLDIEGHELDVLHGALKHINASKPKLAICAYHLPGDLIDLPRFVENLNLGYQIGLRHHSNSRYDTVLYAF